MEREIKLVETCSACPEQYEAFCGDKRVGYLRLRWGIFRVDYPDCGGITIYEKSFNDPYKGTFDSEEERKIYIKKAKTAINNQLTPSKNKNL